MSVFFDAPARLVYTSSRKSQTQEAIGTTGHLTAEKGRRTLFFYRESESNERVMLTTSPVKKIVHEEPWHGHQRPAVRRHSVPFGRSRLREEGGFFAEWTGGE